MQVFEAKNGAEFNKFLISQDASILQSWQWGEFQKKLGRKVWRLLLTTNTGKHLAAVSVVKTPLARGKYYFYSSRGPVVSPSLNLDKIWHLIMDKMYDLKITEKPLFLRIDPPIKDHEVSARLQSLGFEKLPWEVQPKETSLLNLKQTEDQLINSMKPKTRYNIKLAERKGVTVEQFSDGKQIKIFWELMSQTTERDGFSAHPYVYYYNLLEVLGRAGLAKLFIAYYQRRPLAGAIVSFFGQSAVYLHGASSDRFRAVMAPYLVQWAAIRAAKSAGMKYYDFGGIIPTGTSAAHSWAGITRFKKGFGGEEVSYVGAFDLVYDKMWYRMYRLLRRFKKLAN